MYGYPCARRAFSFFILMLALVLSGTGAAAAELSRPTFDPLREKAPMNNDGFRIIARGDAAVPPLTPRDKLANDDSNVSNGDHGSPVVR